MTSQAAPPPTPEVAAGAEPPWPGCGAPCAGSCSPRAARHAGSSRRAAISRGAPRGTPGNVVPAAGRAAILWRCQGGLTSVRGGFYLFLCSASQRSSVHLRRTTRVAENKPPQELLFSVNSYVKVHLQIAKAASSISHSGRLPLHALRTSSRPTPSCSQACPGHLFMIKHF